MALDVSNNFQKKVLKNEGLLQEWEIKIPAENITKDLDEKLTEEQKTFEMKGFREGKVPMPMVRKQLGPKILTKIIETSVDETLKLILKQEGIRPALQPVVEITNFDATGDKKDLTFTVKIESMPKIPSVDWDKIKVSIYKVKITDEDLTKAHADILKNFKNFDKADDSYAAKKGDAVIMDFNGTINGEAFDGNKAEDIRLEIGSGQFIPGFEDQLIGAKANASLKIRAQFPKDYSNDKIANKLAIFEVKVKQVLKPQSVDAIDDEFAKKMNLESLDNLNEMIKQKIESDFNGLARLRMKKDLFDQIDKNNKFDVPPGMLNIDFDSMWKEIEGQMKSNPQMFKGKNKEDLKTEYAEIAKRRVRLGILLAETARENKIEVTENDLQQAVYAEAMLRPGQEKIVLEKYSKPEFLERLKGPLLEEKAVDYLLTKIEKEEIEITSKDFFEKYASELQSIPQDNAS